MDLDSVSLARLKLVYPDLSVRIVRVYEDMHRVHGMRMRCTEGVRTLVRQAELYAQGRTKPGPVVTRAKPGDSIHNYGAAVDSCFLGADPFLTRNSQGAFLWKEFGRFARAHGLTWGGGFKKLPDQPHVEITYGLTLQEIKEITRTKGTAGVWAAFDQIRGVPEVSEWSVKKSSASRCLDLGSCV